jgi:hypothetical protein
MLLTGATIFAQQVDRRSLPRHEFSSQAGYVAPANPIEEAVEAAWREVLGLPQDQPVSVEANWFEASRIGP